MAPDPTSQGHPMGACGGLLLPVACPRVPLDKTFPVPQVPSDLAPALSAATED